MNWLEMCKLEPELQRLEASAENAGKRGASWLATLDAVHECLSKAVGRGALCEDLQGSHVYEVARTCLFVSWLRGHREVDDSDTPPAPPQDSYPWRGPAPGQPCEPAVQMTLFDVSEAYR